MHYVKYKFFSIGCYDGGTFAYLQDNHTSVLGMRETVLQRGAKLQCVKHDEAFKLMNLNGDVDSVNVSSCDLPVVNSLFVFPAQCNFSGFKYPLSWIDGCHRGLLNHIDKKKENIKQERY